MSSKKGFTLIELLVSIIVLGITAVILVPSVSSVIENSKKKTLKSTVINIGRIVSQQCSEEKIDGNEVTTNYIIKNNEISKNIGIRNLPDSGFISVNDDCSAIVSAVSGKYCATKNGNDVTLNTNIYHCGEPGYEPEETKKECFIFDKDTHTITKYNFANKECPLDIKIPAKINGNVVEHIADKAFINSDDSVLLTQYKPEGQDLYMTDLYENMVRKGYNTVRTLIRKIIKKDTTKKCYYNNFKEYDIKPYDYSIDDKYDICDINLDKIYDENFFNSIEKGPVKGLDLSEAYNLKSIGDFAFYNNSIEKIKFGNLQRVTYLGRQAFSYNNISGEIDMSGFRNLKEIRESTFENNNITSLILPSKLSNIGFSAFNSNSIEFISLPSSLENISTLAFAYNAISSIKIQHGVKKLAGFRGNYIKNLDIPDSVIEIDNLAFYNNILDKLVIPSSVKKIKKYAFRSNRIINLQLNEGLEEIDEGAFQNNSIININLPSTLRELRGGAFTLNNVPEGKRFIYKITNGVEDKTTLNSYAGPRGENVINVPSNVEVVDFESMINVLGRTINGKSIKTIKSFAFSDNLYYHSNINLGSKITSIEDDAFNCIYVDMKYCINYINIDRKTNAIAGAPWGNPKAIVRWKGTE